VPAVPADDADVRMDLVVTDAEVVDPRERG